LAETGAASELAPWAPVSGRSWFITGLGIAQIASWGTLSYSFPLIASAMDADLDWSKTALYGAATLGALLSAVLALPVGAAIDRGYGRGVMAGASVLAGTLLVLWAFADNLFIFYIAAAGIGALQAATLYEPAFAVVARRAGPAGARNAITALTLWGGFASTVFIPVVQLLLDLYGWRGTLAILGGVNVLLCATVYWATIDPTRDVPPAPPSTHATDRAPVRAALRNPVFWGLALSFTAYTATFAAFIYHFYPMMLERGFEAHTVVLAMTLIGPAQVAGRIAVRLLGSQASGRRIGSLVVLAFPLAMAVLAWAPPLFWMVGGACILYGAANGVMTIVRGIAIPEMVSPHAYGAINGALAVPMILARAAAPLAAAALWTLSGNYGVVMVAVFAMACCMAVAFWWATALSARTEHSGP
jgi:predicted MFS family arabinose efflux permease